LSLGSGNPVPGEPSPPGRTHRHLRGLDQVRQMVPATAQLGFVVIVSAFDASARQPDQLLRGGDERVGSPEVVAKDAQ
jgi:hypothetical protein